MKRLKALPIALALLLLTACTPTPDPQQQAAERAAAMQHLRTQTLKDAAKVVGIVEWSAFANRMGVIQLKTLEPPFGITVNYSLEPLGLDQAIISEQLRRNATLMLALVENADTVDYVIDGKRKEPVHFERTELEGEFGPLFEQSADAGALQALMEKLPAQKIAKGEKASLPKEYYFDLEEIYTAKCKDSVKSVYAQIVLTLCEDGHDTELKLWFSEISEVVEATLSSFSPYEYAQADAQVRLSKALARALNERLKIDYVMGASFNNLIVK